MELAKKMTNLSRLKRINLLRRKADQLQIEHDLHVHKKKPDSVWFNEIIKYERSEFGGRIVHFGCSVSIDTDRQNLSWGTIDVTVKEKIRKFRKQNPYHPLTNDPKTYPYYKKDIRDDD